MSLKDAISDLKTSRFKTADPASLYKVLQAARSGGKDSAEAAGALQMVAATVGDFNYAGNADDDVRNGVYKLIKAGKAQAQPKASGSATGSKASGFYGRIKSALGWS